jgi:hypothetical protein
MEQAVIDILMNYGAMGVMLVWFMVKNNKDMENFKEIVRQENALTREALNEVRLVIAKVGGQSHE